MKKNVGAVIVAAGSSVRFKSDKLFYEIDGKPVIFHSIKPFVDNSDINRIVVVTDKARAEKVRALFSDCNKLFFTEGGKTRSESVINGLNAISDGEICGCFAEKECDVVAIHDGARPFLSQKLLEALINEAAEKSSAIPFVAATDTVYLRQNAQSCCYQENGAAIKNNAVIGGEKSAVNSFDREKVMLIQTPQVFDYKMIKKAYGAFAEDIAGNVTNCLAESVAKNVTVNDGEPSAEKVSEKVADERRIIPNEERTAHQMKLNPSPFEKIKSGNKTIELRLFDEKRQKIKEGDIITFTDTLGGERISRIVKKLHIFDSFEQLYRTLPLLQCGYTADDVDKACPSDMEQYYSTEEQQKYGVVGIELSPIADSCGGVLHSKTTNCKEILNWATDDSGVFFATYKSLNFVDGDRNNIKITYPSDIPENRARDFCFRENDTLNDGNSVCRNDAGVTTENDIYICDESNVVKEKLIEIPNVEGSEALNLPLANVGTGCDVHRLVEGRRLILGGIEISYEKGLLGHSDADVLLHAIMDAILSAAGERDIGVQFPDTDERYKGISSVLLLRQVLRIVESKGKKITSVSATIIAQKPKLAHIIPLIAENIAKVIDLPTQSVNINATTTEKMGMIGEGEGIGAVAVAVVV